MNALVGWLTESMLQLSQFLQYKLVKYFIYPHRETLFQFIDGETIQNMTSADHK